MVTGNLVEQSFSNLIEVQSKASLDLPKSDADFHKQAQAFLNRGISYFKQGRYRAAKADFSKAVSLSSDNWKGFFCRGLAHLQAERANRGAHKVSILEESGSAIKDFSKVLELKSDCYTAFLFRGCAKFEQALALKNAGGIAFQNLLVESIEDFSKVLQFQKTCSEALYWRARAYQESSYKSDRLSNEEKAFLDYKNAILLKPNFPEAFYHRANLRLDFTDLAGALNDATKAKELFLAQDKIAGYKEAVQLENLIHLRINEFFNDSGKKKERVSFLHSRFLKGALHSF